MVPRILATILLIAAATTFAACGGGPVRAPANSRAAARAGPLAGERLRPLEHDEQFWFAVAAFLPAATIAGQ